MAAQLLLLLMPQLGGHLGQTARTDNSDGCGSLVLLSTAAAAAAAAPPSLAPRPSIRPRALAPRPLEHLLLASRARCCNMSDSSGSSWNMMGEDGRTWPVAVTQGKICSIMYICTYIYICIDMHMHLFFHIYRDVTIGNMLCIRVDKCVIQWWTHLSGMRLSLPVVPVNYITYNTFQT